MNMEENTISKNIRFYLLGENKDYTHKELFEGLKDLNLSSGIFLTNNQIYATDIIMVDILNKAWGETIVKSIKSHPELFLKPLLIFSDHHIEELEGIVDDEIILPVSHAALNDKIKKVHTIAQKVNSLTDISNLARKDDLKEILVLRFLYTRDSYLLAPFRNVTSSLGYSYPLIKLLLDVSAGKEVELIEGLEESLLLKGKLVDKVNLCPFCGHFHINFREVCPTCRSLHIHEEATIHHYRCAHAGRESDFREGDILRCPKCRKELRHIGVDYDKPSANIWCKECGVNFADPLIICLCISCAKTFPPEDAVPRQIKEFSLTAEGSIAAEEGTLPGLGLIDILRKEIGFYKYDVFNEIFKLETRRCTRYKYDSTIARLSIENFKDIVEGIGRSRIRELKKELADIFKSTFRTTDILTDFSDEEYLIAFTHTDTEHAKIALEKLKKKCNAVLKMELDFKYNLLELQGETEDLDAVLKKIG